MNYSQFGQDLKVISYYNNKQNGYFLEIGAADGIHESNTYLLENKYNWSGICVEPVDYQYNELIKNRKCICVNKPIYNESNRVIQFCKTIPDIRHLSGIKEHIVIDKVHNNSSIIELETLSLNDLLNHYNAPCNIDYLSLDTEGSEYEILKSFNFDKYKFGYINVEHNYTEPKRTLLKDLLFKNNYHYVGENYVDDIYVYKIT
jgi:FkbM family methyltransferase